MARIPVSIVVATSYRYRLLEGLLKSLNNQTFREFETILICIEIDEKMREISSEYGVKLLEDGGKGLEYARNLGLSKAEGRIVIFLDDDVVLEKDWLEMAVKNFNLNPGVGGFGGFPIAMKDGKVLSHFVIFENVSDFMIHRTEGMSGWQGKSGSCRENVDFLSGSNMAFRRDVLLQIGGFDENFYGSSVGEDVDICLRVLKEGYYLVLDPKAKVYHYSDCIERWATFHKNDPAFFFALADNQTYLPVKHQIIRGPKWLPYILFRFSNALFWMLKTRNIRVFFSYIKGIFRGRIRGKFLVHHSLLQGRLGRSSVRD